MDSLLGQINPYREDPHRHDWRKPVVPGPYSGMYHSPAAANRAIARLASWMTSHPDAGPGDAPSHIVANAARAQAQLGRAL